MKDAYSRLLHYMERMPVFNTHSHHCVQQMDMDLNKMLSLTYLNFEVKEKDAVEDGMEDFIDRMKYNSYFVWLEKSLQALYDIENPLDICHVEKTNEAIQRAYSRQGHSISVLEKTCCYRYMVVDAYWKPGEIEQSSGIFLPAYRINMYLYGYNQYALDHNGNNPYQINRWKEVDDLDAYVVLLHEALEEQINKGCVALKCASAYDRGLNFKKTKKADAEKAFQSGRGQGGITEKEVEDFQNYIFYEICKFAASHHIPLQCHTGLGLLNKTSAIYLQEVIQDNPDTQFVLFHGSYPWMDDLCGLVCNYRNVYVDFCWLPIISTYEAEQLLNKIIDIGDISKIYWGCDTWLAEDSYGALLAMKHVLASLLGNKIEQGMMTYESAESICIKILYDNACKLYIK